MATNRISHVTVYNRLDWGSYFFTLNTMSSVYFPAHVVLVLRRIVNVISSLSITNQYILLKQAKADQDRTQKPQMTPNLSGVKWPSWTFKHRWDYAQPASPESIPKGILFTHPSHLY